MKPNLQMTSMAFALAATLGATTALGHEPEPVVFSENGVPYAWFVELGANEHSETPGDHVGAWSWDEDTFPATTRGWTHTSKFVKLELTQAAAFTLTLSNKADVAWPSAEDPNRKAANNLFPSFTLYRGWDTDGPQDHTFNNRGNIEWAEGVTYLDHLENTNSHSITRTWFLPAGEYTINLGGNSPATIAEGRQGYIAAFATAPLTVPTTNASLATVDFSEFGVPYGLTVSLDDQSSAQTPPDHVGAWSWDEDTFPATTRGWTHTSKFVRLNLTKAAQFTLSLSSATNVPWPSSQEPNRLAGTNLFPSFTLYRGWDTDGPQDHTFNNRGDIEWAEGVKYLDHLENTNSHAITRTWFLPAGLYTINLGGNSPATIAEGRQGYAATFVTTPLTVPTTNAALAAVDFSEFGVPYGWALAMDDQSSAQTPGDHVGAWSWDEDTFPATTRGWTHTSKFVRLNLLKAAQFSLKLSSATNVAWPSSQDPNRKAGTNLFPSFTLYRGWDTSGAQDHTFNNRGDIEWAEAISYVDHLENTNLHSVTRTWTLAPGLYTINLGGNSPATIAEGRQGYVADFTTAPATLPVTNAAMTAVEFSENGIPYGVKAHLTANSFVALPPDHVGAWSWDEDTFPQTARGWTHTSKFIQLELSEATALTLRFSSATNVPWPSSQDPNRLAGTNLFPSFTLYRGWDTDGPQDHTFNNRGNIEWAESAVYLSHYDNATNHAAVRTWTLPAGRYTLNLGGNSPATIAEGRQGYEATLSTRRVPRLGFNRNGGNLVFDWSQDDAGFQLFRSSSPAGPWTPASGTPNATGGRWNHSITAEPGPVFFRLQQP